MRTLEDKWQTWLAAYDPKPTGYALREMRFTFFAGVIALRSMVEDENPFTLEEIAAVNAEVNAVVEEMSMYWRGIN